MKYGRKVNLRAKAAPFFQNWLKTTKFLRIQKIASEEKIFSKFEKLLKN